VLVKSFTASLATQTTLVPLETPASLASGDYATTTVNSTAPSQPELITPPFPDARS
jgi:hypothetical protein